MTFASKSLPRHNTGLYSYTRLKRTVRLGIKSVWSHRLRSLLTVLGIVFGVCSVIAMLAIGEGLSFEAQEQIRRLGSQNIIVRSVKPPENQSSTADRSWAIEYGITYDDLDRIRMTLPAVEIVVPSRAMRRDVWNLGRRVDCDVMGTVPWHPQMTSSRVAAGRFFTDFEFSSNANVCVLGAGVAEQLFPIDDPLGKSVRIGDGLFTVIGTMADGGSPTSSTAAMGGAANDGGDKGASTAANVAAPGTSPGAAQYQVYIPLSTSKARYGEVQVKRSSGSRSIERIQLSELTVKVDSLDAVVPTARIIEDLLGRYHKKKDYSVMAPLELLRQAERTKRMFNIVLGAIAAISLLVGGIGIMNIMLASVTERTREIGIRRALGAKRGDIVLQFLIETVLLSATGGIIGVALGLSVPLIITHFAHMKTIVTLWSPILAFGISAIIGVVFGLYPAMRAADMDPVEALRHE
ncbi:MAG TPA: ABC transporter permease [Candidatus Hydrogenedentes bacterium]|nr:ABC transporter permease [Candidatus Hydrogenedentota bacterium]